MTARKFSQWVKPGVPRSVHLFAAPFLWTAVGCLLMYRGYNWIKTEQHYWLLALSFSLGTLKSMLILDKVVRKSIERIVHFKDNTCLGALYSWKSWLMVVMMMTAGIVIRRVGHPGQLVGMLYCAIGWALCFSSRLGWAQWYSLRNAH
ncbi:MAG: hypothetical protein PHI97_15760 [Desulfobulbus sp.]|nr:hypothetical protein [Desulfobulbus sp.]